MRRALLVCCVAGMVLAGCGSSRPTVCHVRPSADGKTLIYTPAGCQHHLAGETLDIQSQ